MPGRAPSREVRILIESRIEKSIYSNVFGIRSEISINERRPSEDFC